MVLEASSISDSYDASPETPDPYETSSQLSTDLSSIDLTKLPHPLPIIGPLFGYTDTYLHDLATLRVRYHTEGIGRPLAQPEREAIFYHSYKSAKIMSIGVPFFVGSNLYRAYTTRENYRFPGYGPLKTEGGWFDGQKIRIMGQVVAEGSRAQNIVHALRYSGYGFIALFLARLVVGSYATTVAAVGELRDPRLKDYRTMLKEKASERQQAITKGTQRKNDPTGQVDTSASDLWKRHRKDIGGFDDASPSAGSDGYSYGQEVDKLGGSNTGFLSDAQMRARETKQQASPNDSPTENRASTFRLEKVEKQPQSFNDMFDDANPTAAADGKRADQSQGGGGNAWARIRRQTQNPSAAVGMGKQRGPRWNPVKKEQQEGSTTGDSFAFSSEDEQRQLAKDEAQNEFDARVERERQGGSFNENRGKRW
ncbi:MAG: hypothetical protein Q9221_008406 [Calogaya cf. arnoldii]